MSVSAAQPRPQLPRLFALGLAACVLFVLAFFARKKLEANLRAATPELAPLPLREKNQGLVLQRDAFEAKNVLPVFGSSELTIDQDNRASDVFASAPTGFQVCPIGSAGNTCILSLMKVAALGKAVRDEKLVVILSPGWFVRPQLPADQFAGNFSPLHAIRTLENRHLSADLKARIARRLLDYADAIESNPALLMRIRALAQPSGLSSLLRPFEDALLQLDAAFLEYEDDVHSLHMMHKHGAKVDRTRSQTPSWDQLLASAKASYVPSKLPRSTEGEQSSARRNGLYLQRYSEGDKGEWLDLELMLNVLKELHAKPLIISMPLAGKREDISGVLPATRHTAYYGRLQRLCDERHILCRTMEDHDEDPDFLIKFISHPSAVGWVHIDRLLDDFWHDRLIPTWTTKN